MSEEQINEWTVDFSQAKIAIHNLEVLVTALTQAQSDVVLKLKGLFEKFGVFLGDDATPKQREAIAEQVRIFERISSNLHMTTTKFAARANGQLDSARTQVNFIYHTLGKLHSHKAPQYAEAAEKIGHQVPEFLNLFDAFLARFTLEVRWQQADFYKQLGDAFTHAGRPEPIKSVVQSWLTEYEQIMPAVEALKSVRPQPEHARRAGISAPEASGLNYQSEKTESVLFTPVKWIHSKFTRDLKDFRFSDPRRGFFNKPTHPPKSKSEVVRAVFDFNGETESDLRFKKGDVITIVDKGTEDDPNWWCGEFNGERGLFPRNYVEEIPNEEAGQRKAVHPDEYVPREIPPDEKGEKEYNPEVQEGEEDVRDIKEPANELDEEEHPPARPPRPPKLSTSTPASPTEPRSPTSPKSPSGPSNISSPSRTSDPTEATLAAAAGTGSLDTATGMASGVERTSSTDLSTREAHSSAVAASETPVATNYSAPDSSTPPEATGVTESANHPTSTGLETRSTPNPHSPKDSTAPESPGRPTPVKPSSVNSAADHPHQAPASEAPSEHHNSSGAIDEIRSDIGGAEEPSVTSNEDPVDRSLGLGSEAKKAPGVSEAHGVSEAPSSKTLESDFRKIEDISKPAGDSVRPSDKDEGQVTEPPAGHLSSGSEDISPSAHTHSETKEPTLSNRPHHEDETTPPTERNENSTEHIPPLPARKSVRKIPDDKDLLLPDTQESNQDADDELL